MCYSISWMYVLPCWLSFSFKWVCDQYYESYTHFPSQFHHVRWEFVKVFQHRGEYKGSKPTIALFLHLFKVKSGSKYVNGSNVISLRKSTKYFEPYSYNVNNFKDWFFLVVLLNQESYSKICWLDHDAPFSCTNIFHKYWTYSHVLTRVEMYYYREEYFSREKLYLKGQLVSFFHDLG